jgi:hypothetical protein
MAPHLQHSHTGPSGEWADSLRGVGRLGGDREVGQGGRPCRKCYLIWEHQPRTPPGEESKSGSSHGGQ